MSGQIIHIISDYRSGSTLVGQLLGAHPSVISVGELHHLRAYVLGDRTLHDPSYALRCSCGEPISSCQFWASIEASLKTELSNLKLKPRLPGPGNDVPGISAKLRDRTRRLFRRLVAAPPNPVTNALFGISRFVEDTNRLYRTILNESAAEYLVDSSKDLTRCRLLVRANPDIHRAILLCRDYRGVVHSKRKRGKSLKESAQSWAKRVWDMEAVAAEMPDDQVYRLKYEDLCKNPENEMRSLCGFLSLAYAPEMTKRPVNHNHQIAGSPSRLDTDRSEIKSDTSYKDAFTGTELDRLRSIVGDAAAAWGYD